MDESGYYATGGLNGCGISLPVAFNPWKHHLEFIRSAVARYRGNPEALLWLKRISGFMGGTLLDVYVGRLGLPELVGQVVRIAEQQRALTPEGLGRWIGLPVCSYTRIMLSDGSCWVVKPGRQPDRFLHIHPGRFSAHTERCRPSTLIQAVAYAVLFGADFPEPNLNRINRAREAVALPPLDTRMDCSAVLRTIALLTVKNA